MFRKKKDKSSTSQYYVQFLGWLPSLGVTGSQYTAPAIRELLNRLKEYSNLPKLTLKVMANGIEISSIHNNESKKKPLKVFHIQLVDIMFVSLESDIGACIFRYRNSPDVPYLQVHVYRFDSTLTVQNFVKSVQGLITTAQHIQHVRCIEERYMQESRPLPSAPAHPGVTATTTSGNASTAVLPNAHQMKGGGGATPSAPPPPGEHEEGEEEEGELDIPHNIVEDPQVQAITDELKMKFKSKGGPLLYPAKDYDTVRRKQGHLDKMGTRKCRNGKIMGSGSFDENDEDDDDDDDVEDEDLKRSPNFPLYPPKNSPSSPTIPQRWMQRGGDSAQSSPDLTQQSVELRYRRQNSAKQGNNGVDDVNGGGVAIGGREASRKSLSPTTTPADSPRISHSFNQSLKNDSKNSTISSHNSGSSHHSDSLRNNQSEPSEANLEIPPDYDESPQRSRFITRRPLPPPTNQPLFSYYGGDLPSGHPHKMGPGQPHTGYPDRRYHSSTSVFEDARNHRPQSYPNPQPHPGMFVKPYKRSSANLNFR
ncbi:uncharacterized protein LOC115224792 [Argonauta hians]